MKKINVAIFICISCIRIIGMEDTTKNQKKFISILPYIPIYVGQSVDDQKKREMFLPTEDYKPNEIVQKVIIWQNINGNKTRLKDTPTHLRYNLLKQYKEGDTFKIPSKNEEFEVIAQKQNPFDPLFEQELIIQKKKFDDQPNYIIEDKDFLLKRYILQKSFFGNIVHGPNGIEQNSTGFYASIGTLIVFGLSWYYNPGSITDLCKSFFNSWWND